jgi:hypothetical protein
MTARKMPRSHVPTDSSFAGLGAGRGWRWSGRFIASACATMLIVEEAHDANEVSASILKLE